MAASESRPAPAPIAAIGVIHSEHQLPERTPIQPVYAHGCGGSAHLFPEYEPGLRDIEGFSHLILLYQFHQSTGIELVVKPFTDDTPRGVFATRHPNRPNRIGISIVRLERVEGTVLHLRDVDILDGTPLLDVKPYVPRFDTIHDAAGGWTEEISEGIARTRGMREHRGTIGRHLLLLARSGARANRSVVEALRRLPEGERMRDRGSFARSLHGLLDHLAEGALYFQRELRRSYPAAAALAHPHLDRPTRYRELTFADFTELAEVVAATDLAFIGLVSELSEEDYTRTIPIESIHGTDRRTTLLLLLQAMNHATHHRGQISQILDEMGIDNDWSGIGGDEA